MITGNKIGLRAVEKEDLTLLRDWRNISDFRRNFREVRELSLADQEKWFESLQQTRNINFMFTIVSLSDNRPIGAAGLLYINWINRSADFSFYIGEKSAYIDDQGLAEDAADLLLRYGYNNLNLNKIWMELYEFDDRKLKFFKEHFNFQEDGRLRQNCFENGRYWDSFIISLLRKDFKTIDKD